MNLDIHLYGNSSKGRFGISKTHKFYFTSDNEFTESTIDELEGVILDKLKELKADIRHLRDNGINKPSKG